jgi:hypothetical protein
LVYYCLEIEVEIAREKRNERGLPEGLQYGESWKNHKLH